MNKKMELKKDFKGLAKMFKALSDENRLRILVIIYEITVNKCCDITKMEDEACIKNLASHLNITLPTVSHHIKELVNADLIITKKKGRWIHCQLNQKRLDVVRKFLNDLKE